MENTVYIKNAILGALAVIGSGVTNALGGWDAGLQVLIVCMAADYITGLMVAGIWHKSGKSDSGALDSRASFRGLLKKGAILLLILVGVQLDRFIGGSYVRTALILFFVGNEGLSLLENLGLMGVPYPKVIKNALEALKNKGEENESK